MLHNHAVAKAYLNITRTIYSTHFYVLLKYNFLVELRTVFIYDSGASYHSSDKPVPYFPSLLPLLLVQNTLMLTICIDFI